MGLFKAASGKGNDEEGSIEFNLAGLFKIMCCTHQKSGDEKQQLFRIAESLEKLNKRLDLIERAVDPHGMLGSRRRSTSRASVLGTGAAGDAGGLPSVHEEEDLFNEDSEDESETVGTDWQHLKKRLRSQFSSFFVFGCVTEPKTERDELINPYWIEDKDLKRGEVDYLSGPEIQFWKDLLDKYLYPIDENKEEQVSIGLTNHELLLSNDCNIITMNNVFCVSG